MYQSCFDCHADQQCEDERGADHSVRLSGFFDDDDLAGIEILVVADAGGKGNALAFFQLFTVRKLRPMAKIFPAIIGEDESKATLGLEEFYPAFTG